MISNKNIIRCTSQKAKSKNENKSSLYSLASSHCGLYSSIPTIPSFVLYQIVFSKPPPTTHLPPSLLPLSFSVHPPPNLLPDPLLAPPHHLLHLPVHDGTVTPAEADEPSELPPLVFDGHALGGPVDGAGVLGGVDGGCALVVKVGDLVELSFGQEPEVEEGGGEGGVDEAGGELDQGGELEGHLGEFGCEGRGDVGAAGGEVRAGGTGEEGGGSVGGAGGGWVHFCFCVKW